MSNPLKPFCRQPALYLKLPSMGKWYTETDVELISGGEVPIYGLSAIDDIMLNTPDAMLNGQALENVIKNCVPTVKNVKSLVLPDLESIFIAIKLAGVDNTYDIDRKCPACKHENTFGVDLQTLLDTQTYVEESDCSFIMNTKQGDLIIHVKPYVLELRQIYMHKEMTEQALLKQIDNSNTEMDQFEKAKIIAESIERLSQSTFDLVSRSITKVTIVSSGLEVTDKEFIAEWLSDVSKEEASQVIDAVANLNQIGVNKKTTMICEACDHSWDETMEFDPTSFFTKR